MRFNKILLVSPPSSSKYGGLRVPAGIGYIAQALYDREIEYDYIDMRIQPSFSKLRHKIKKFGPDLIGISMITLEYARTYAMIFKIKIEFPHIKIVVGGHHLTILKQQVLEECRAIDFGAMNEGEETLVELCEGQVPIDRIQGLIHRSNEAVISNGERPCPESLDRYNFPRYHKFNMNHYSRQIPVNSSRGCPYQCVFCPNKLLGRKYQARSVAHFVDEIQYWYNRGYRQFAIDDDNFTLIKQRVYEICDEIERRRLDHLFIRCSNGVRADRVDRELLKRLKQVGVREIGFGVDGGNNKVLRYLKKGETIETIDTAVKNACELGFDVRLFFLVGTPGETRADVEDSMCFAQKYPVGLLNVNSPIPYPGTELFDHINEHNLFLMQPEEYLNRVAEEKPIPVFETPELKRDERIQLLKEFHAIERKVMKNAAIRMYRGYPLAGFFITYFFNVQLFEKLFFKNIVLRKFFERIRYQKIIAKTAN